MAGLMSKAQAPVCRLIVEGVYVFGSVWLSQEHSMLAK